MQHLDLTLPTPAENLALDEALLDEAEAAQKSVETLRLWESPEPMVVLGRSSRVEREVHVEACRDRSIPILRRSSGGATVLAGPGCLMYAVVLDFQRRPFLRAVDRAHEFVLGTIADSLRPLASGVVAQGTSDLTLDGLKFSGNSLRVKRNHLLYHGTLLYDFPLALVTDCLRTPPRQPDYRAGRSHESFLTNLPLESAALRLSLITGWNAAAPRANWPREQTAQLVRERYGRREWAELG